MGLLANAAPGGVIPGPVYEGLRGELLADLRASLPVDGVVLYPHGAMVAEGYDDCAGDLLASVRQIVSPGVPVGAALGPHGNLTEDMLRHATVLVGFKECPPIDAIDRIREVFELMAETAEGKIRPTTARFECRMIEAFPTTSEPMKTVVREMRDLKSQTSVLNVWLCHGFPYVDVPTIGAQAVAITDGDASLAAQVAERVGRRLFSLRKRLRRSLLTIDQSLTQALRAERGPVTIADSADNLGGGAPGDSTFFLRKVIDSRIEGAALGTLYDPQAVSICHDAGLGSKLQLRIGAKLGPTSGDPIDVTCTVIGLADEVAQNTHACRFRSAHARA